MSTTQGSAAMQTCGPHQYGTRLMRHAVVIVGAMVALMAMPFAQAQNYPSRQIRLIAPYAASSTVDIIARLFGQKLGEAIGQAVLVDNLPGAGGSIGTTAALRAPADGYTMLIVPSTQLTSASLYKNPPYEITRDFTPLAIPVNAPNVVLVNTDVAARNLAELLALAKAKPGQLNYAHTGRGTPTHLFVEMLKSTAGIDVVGVAYKSGAQAVTDLIGGQVAIMYSNAGSGLPLIKAGRVRPLAVSGSQRLPLLPDVPTVGEILPGYEAAVWFGFYVRSDTPPAIVARLSQELARIAQLPEVKEKMLASGLVNELIVGEAAINRVKLDTQKLNKVVRDVGIQPE